MKGLLLLLALAAVVTARPSAEEAVREALERPAAELLRLRQVPRGKLWIGQPPAQKDGSNLPPDSNVVLSNANSITNQVVVPNCIGVGCPGAGAAAGAAASVGGGNGGGGGGAGGGGSVTMIGGPKPRSSKGVTVTNSNPSIGKKGKAGKGSAAKTKRALKRALKSGALAKGGLGHAARKALKKVLGGGRRAVSALGKKANRAARDLVKQLQKGGGQAAARDLNQKVKKLVKKGLSFKAAVKNAIKKVARKDGLNTKPKHRSGAAKAAKAGGKGRVIPELTVAGPAASTREMSYTRDQRRAFKSELKEKTAKRKLHVQQQLRREESEERKKGLMARKFAEKMRRKSTAELDRERQRRFAAEHQAWRLKYEAAQKREKKNEKQAMVDAVLK